MNCQLPQFLQNLFRKGQKPGLMLKVRKYLSFVLYVNKERKRMYHDVLVSTIR